MAPKKSRASSSGPSRASSSGPSGKAKAKAKSKAGSTPAAELDTEAEQMFQRYQIDGRLDGMLTLKEFSQYIRDMNSKKCMIWGQAEDCGPIIKEEWKKLDGFSKREISCSDFKGWFPGFLEIMKARQEEIETAKAEKAAKSEAEKQAVAALCAGDGVWTVPMKVLPDAIQRAKDKGKTALLIDNTEHHNVETFYTYSGAHIIECKKMIMDKTQGKSVSDILDDERGRFLRSKCFQAGQTLMFRLANSAADLTGMWNSDAFPTVAFLNEGILCKLRGKGNLGNVEESPFVNMCLDNDEKMDLTAFGIHDDFTVVVITHFPESDYEEYLKDAIPLSLMQPIKPTVD